MTIADPLEQIEWRGWPRMDRKTAAALSVAERDLGYTMDIVQGPYNPSRVAASAGTHDEGGVVDLSPFDHAAKVRALRDVGFAAWYRPPLAGEWAAHVHAVLIGHQDLAPSAQRQVASYNSGRNGLANNAMDPNTYHPDVEDFSYAKWLHDTELREKIVVIQHERKRLADKISALRARRERLKIKAQQARANITYK